MSSIQPMRTCRPAGIQTRSSGKIKAHHFICLIKLSSTVYSVFFSNRPRGVKHFPTFCRHVSMSHPNLQLSTAGRLPHLLD